MHKVKIPKWKRAVIKVGSALVAPKGKKCSTKHVLPIANFIIESLNKDKEIILVSSGAVAAGLSTQRHMRKKYQRTIPEKQALAAIGQTLLMRTWSRFFDFPCAQLLLTYDDIHNRERFVNAKNTLNKLLELQTLPIINENDTVAVDELKLGDNDNLAAHVAVLAEADLLIICTDIDGLYNGNPATCPDAELIPAVKKIDPSVYSLAGDSTNPIATGGMFTKIEAAEKATSRGINTIIINGKIHENYQKILEGSLCGTFFQKTETPMAAKKHWMLHALEGSGRVIIDEGAAKAICVKGASLLPSGILQVDGEFTMGEAVKVVVKKNGRSKEIAKGITQYGSHDLTLIKGRKSKEIETILSYFHSDVVIQRDDLVLLKSSKQEMPL